MLPLPHLLLLPQPPPRPNQPLSSSYVYSLIIAPLVHFFSQDTRVTPAFAVLGAILVITGIPSTFWGHKNRWSASILLILLHSQFLYRTSFFLIGFYTLALVCAVLILKFGVLPAINPPTQTLIGMFVLSATVAGVAGGAIAIFFWKVAIYGIGAWGGFALALWIQAFHDGGVIKSTSFRWILYISITFLLLYNAFPHSSTNRLCRRWFHIVHNTKGNVTSITPHLNSFFNYPSDSLPRPSHFHGFCGCLCPHTRNRLLYNSRPQRGMRFSTPRSFFILTYSPFLLSSIFGILAFLPSFPSSLITGSSSPYPKLCK